MLRLEIRLSFGSGLRQKIADYVKLSASPVSFKEIYFRGMLFNSPSKTLKHQWFRAIYASHSTVFFISAAAEGIYLMPRYGPESTGLRVWA